MRKTGVSIFLVALLAIAAGAEEKTSNLKFVVLKQHNGKPVRSASVILHTVDKKGKQGKGGLQTKTDSEGRAMIPSIPYGKMRVQVIAHGFQTFGEDYEVNQPEQEFVIKLKMPQEQYTIYK
ncbi:MAG: carboxypeptidase-like regulatory domain-containing protein [Acidobacteriia bacterium]|nr:carboxypeptidase-like regulatory domain-containing protein [Terriglobia bacterium]